MTRRAYIYFLATFLLGVVVGGSAVLFYGWHWGHWHRGFSRHRTVQHLTRELHLSDQQVRQLNQIMDETGRKFEELRKQVNPQFEALREERYNRVRQILTPEQLEKFNEQVRRHEGKR